MLGIILGVLVILLGAKAFTPNGLPLTKKKNLTGTTAKVIGVVCILLGFAFIADGVLASFSIVNLLSGVSQNDSTPESDRGKAESSIREPRRTSSKDAIIADFVNDAMLARTTVIASLGGVFSDAKAYRDGKEDGVVLEYVFAADATIDRSKSTQARAKQESIREFGSDSKIKRFVRKGIYLRMIYKSFDGDVVMDFTVTAADL